MNGILKGIRVLDLSRMLSGPYCTMMLADHGAEVIKIEAPGGDTSRGNGPFRDDDPGHDWAGYFVSLNRSKKSVMLDLKSPQGKAAFRTLVRSADVVVENFRPGVMERLDLAYESLAEINPRLVYAAIRGFGDPRSGASPYGLWPSYDVVAQAMGGLISITGPDARTPIKTGPGIGDIFAGMMMSFGILAALRAAEATGRGQFVDVAMYDAMISLCERLIYQHDFQRTIPVPEGNGHPLLAPFGIFPATDGHVAIGIVDDVFWRALAGAMGRADLAEDPRYATRPARLAHKNEVQTLVADWTRQQDKAGLGRKLGGLVPFGPVNDAAGIFADPHVAARAMIAEIPHPDTGRRPWKVAANPLRFGGAATPTPTPPPRLGAQTEAWCRPRSEPKIDPYALRNAFGAFATGVTVLTTRQPDGTPRGFTANSFASVSLDPPLLLVCLAKSAHSCDTFMQSTHFAVNVLAEDQKGVSGLFASREADKFAQCAWTPGAEQMPLIDGALAHFVCSREKSVDAGDHIVLIGRVIDFVTVDANPLGYFKGNYFSIGLENSLVDVVAATGGTCVGGVLTHAGRILLVEAADGTLSLPAAPGKVPGLAGLREMLVTRGLQPELEFLYAVYEDRETGIHRIYYHGQVNGPVPEGMVMIPLDILPWDRIAITAERSMLHRYQQEFRHGAFSIYQGDEISGKVRQISGD
ncbi:MAG: CoA transferase [Rhodobacteraceae bacterium]|nr:CoA transferase [Paracoccaceae bacterium]MCP5341765.1 CoA transferase [Paracoccaceae bacterium]